MRKIVWAIGLVCCAVFATQTVRAQAVPVSMEYTEVYDFIDELITDGYIVRQTAVRPYTRTQIANMLLEASRPPKSPLKGDFGSSPFKGETEGVLILWCALSNISVIAPLPKARSRNIYLSLIHI